MQRRNFIRLVGGGTLAATTLGAAGCADLTSGAYPAAAVEAWRGPSALDVEPRRRALAYAITAPNPHNLQPWLVDLREPNAITVYTDAQRLLPETDPLGRQILIGHGAFLELLVMSLAQQGLAAQVTLWPQGELPTNLSDWRSLALARPIARIALAPGATADPLFAQILQRRTAKSDFDIAKPVAPATLQALLAINTSANAVRSAGTVEGARLPPLRALCQQSAKVELQTARTFMESIQLIRVGPAEIGKHRDGISINTPSVRLLSAVGMFDRSSAPAEGTVAFKNALARFDGHSASAMGFVWLSTAGNRRSQQIDAGRAYVRLQLKATELGVGMHPMSQALQEFAEMKPHFEQAHQLLLGKPAPRAVSEDTVQMFCRVGYPLTAELPSPRRALAQFVKA